MFTRSRRRFQSHRDQYAEDGRHPLGRDHCTCDEVSSDGCIIHDPFYHDRKRNGMITFKSGIWIADLPFAAKDELKAAGFEFHGDPLECKRQGCRACRAGGVYKKWWSDSAEVVRKINSAVIDPAAANALAEHDEVVEASSAEDAPIDVPAPPGLEYYPFQLAGIAYIQRAPAPRRVLLGDDMGLGKTIQAIGYMNLTEVLTAVVVCPANLRINWKRELETWLTESRNIYIVDSDDPPPPSAEVVIVNYERLIRPPIFDALMGWCWELLICDEAHALKTPTAKRTIAVLGQEGNKRKKIEAKQGLIHRASCFLPITGTAMLSRPIELWTLLHALDPEGYPDKHKYGRRYCAGHQKRIGWNKLGGEKGPDGRPKGAPKMAWDFKGASNLEELQDKLRGRCMVRRLKSEVLPELPPKRHEIIVLDPRHASVALKAQTKMWMEQGSAELHMALSVIHGEGIEHRDDYEDIVARLDAELEIAFEKMSAERKRVAVAKIPLVLDHLKNLLDNHEVPKLIVFAHHHEVIDALMGEIDSAVCIDGRVSPEDRQDAVDLFQGDASCRVLIAGIRAGGEGITLTASSHLVFAELDWTPARNTQAEDRSHRIGQKDSVLIQHLVFDQSIDAMIAKLLIRKQKIIKKTLDRGC
jgi:SWI/SNF-related matrix-associated actin-dependent regulator 1 of chromatin subfamily A